ncbi:unnamed protein product [Prorocentrum cordatum]|uniref:Subtilisin n=1 Tax=Prorocentrum cordatum TaxID=2364126 RepID=A0ABN9QPF2_9DINO|nr:unnamed protein product [Polarella glacialis]
MWANAQDVEFVAHPSLPISAHQCATGRAQQSGARCPHEVARVFCARLVGPSELDGDLSGVDSTPNGDTSISESSVFGSREGAAAVIFQAGARQVWASGRVH